MTTIYKGHKIDYKFSGAIVYNGDVFVKAFASDEKGTSEVSGLDKAKSYIDSINK